jgi:hypothetical protein
MSLSVDPIIRAFQSAKEATPARIFDNNDNDVPSASIPITEDVISSIDILSSSPTVTGFSDVTKESIRDFNSYALKILHDSSNNPSSFVTLMCVLADSMGLSLPEMRSKMHASIQTIVNEKSAQDLYTQISQMNNNMSRPTVGISSSLQSQLARSADLNTTPLYSVMSVNPTIQSESLAHIRGFMAALDKGL